METTETLTTWKLKKLAAYEAPLCLTLTMACITSGDQQQQNAIRFKNLLQEAQDKLEKVGCREQKIKEFLSPLERLLDENELWKNLDNGLMVCVSDDMHELYDLPFAVDVNVIVDRHFYLRPVIPHMQETGETAILLLSMNDPALLFARGTNGYFETETPPEPLGSFEEYMNVYDPEKSLQFRSQGYDGGTYATMPGYHGQGMAGDDATQKRHLREYFKQLENWVSEALQQRQCPEVFLVAEPHLEGLYKSVMRSNNLRLRKLAQKNPGSEKPEIWAAHARHLLEDGLEQERESTLGVFRRLKKKHENSIEENIPDIVRAAYNHRIETLMVPDTSQDYCWGHFDPETRTVHKQKQDERVTGPGDELVNLAVIKTFLNGGKILPLPQNRAPETSVYPDYAALCRW